MLNESSEAMTGRFCPYDRDNTRNIPSDKKVSDVSLVYIYNSPSITFHLDRTDFLMFLMNFHSGVHIKITSYPYYIPYLIVLCFFLIWIYLPLNCMLFGSRNFAFICVYLTLFLEHRRYLVIVVH